MEAFSEKTSFKVKESVGINMFLASVCAIAAGFILVFNDGFDRVYLLMLTIPLCVFSVISAVKNQTVILVDRSGIYSQGNLVTDWYHFMEANYTQQHKRAGRISDDYVLIVNYSKDGYDGYFTRTLSLGFTQDKSEEAVPAAIQFYYDVFRKENFGK